MLKTSLSYIDIQPSGQGKSVHFFSQSHLFGILKLFLPFFHFPAKKFLSCYRWIFISPLTLTFQSLFAVDQRHESISAIYKHLLTAFSAKKKKKDLISDYRQCSC